MHVLVITNQDADLKWLNELLFESGFNVFTLDISERKAATSFIKSVRFDFIIFDLSVSKAIVLKGLRKLAASYGNVPLVVVDNLLGESTVVAAVQHAAKTYVIKGRSLETHAAPYSIALNDKKDFNYN